jgi:PAS domain S-box-containing protein
MQAEKTKAADLVPVTEPAARSRVSASRVARLVLAAAAYFVVGKLGLDFAFLHESASAIWPATGVALALLLLWGTRLWPAIFAGAFLVNLTTAGGPLSALMIATGNTLEALAGAWLVNRYARGRRAFDHAADIVRFWFFACMVATSISATIGILSLCITGIAQWANFGPLWRTWWLGDAVGGFVGCALILLWSRRPHIEWTPRRIFEATLVGISIVTVSLIVFHGLRLNQSFNVIPILLWSAFRLGRRETAAAILILAIIGAWGTLSGKGPFANAVTSPNDALLIFQSFLAVLAVTSLTVAAVVEERGSAVVRLRAAHDDLERRVHERTVMLSTTNSALREEIGERRLAEERFRRLLESAPDAMIIVGAGGNIELVNSQTEALFGYRREELIGKPVEVLVPDDRRIQHRTHRNAYTVNPHARPMGPGLELHGLRRDRTEFPVEIALSPIQFEGEHVICAAIRDKTEQKALEARLMAAERERGDSMRDLAAFVQGAQEEERRRVARELHDDLGQRLAALKLSMQVLEHDVAQSEEPYRARLHTLVTDVDRMIAEVRRLSYNLRPLALDDFGLTVALEMLCRETDRLYGVKTNLNVSDSLPSFGDTHVDIALYRIAQGAMSNVARHSGASRVAIDLLARDGSFVMSIVDDGRGFDTGTLRNKRTGLSGLGLIGMRERAEMLGGTFKITSRPGEGARVDVEIPIRMESSPG